MLALRNYRSLLLLPAILLVGCESLSPAPKPPDAPKLSFTAANRPVFTTAYYPYGVCMGRHLAAPIPNYNNWTAGRMVRDLRRIQDTGFDEVLLCLSTDIANDPFGLRRALEFISQAERLGGVQITFLIEAGTVPLRRDVFAERLVAARVHTSTVALEEAGRLVVFLRDGVEVIGASHPAIFFRTVKQEEWFWAASGRLSDRTLERDNGRILQRNIWQAYHARAQRIVIAWNDFETGNFVEPNSHDTEADVAMLTVRTETRRVNDAVQASRTGTGPALELE